MSKLRVRVDDDFAKRSFENLGAWIMGRNMAIRPIPGGILDVSC